MSAAYNLEDARMARRRQMSTELEISMKPLAFSTGLHNIGISINTGNIFNPHVTFVFPEM